MAEIQLFDERDLKVTGPTILFPGYERLKEQALEIADHIRSMEVTEDNVKETKKILARVNKSVKELNDRRIKTKKEILKPYDDFEKQVKEIEKIVKDADEIVRSQVRQMEEEERQAKEEEIRSLWDLRMQQYDLAKILSFEDFLTPQHLNKSMSMSKIEAEMVDFLEKTENDVALLSTMADSEELLAIYKEFKDMTVTLKVKQERDKDKAAIKEIIKDSDTETIETYSFQVFNLKDYNFVKSLMENNEINYKEI